MFKDFNWQEKIDFVMDCVNQVAQMLNHTTITTTAQYYLDPRILAHWSFLNKLDKLDYIKTIIIDWGWIEMEEEFKF